MRKIFVMSVLALAIAGCSNQQHSRPQVRDVSDAQQAVKNTPQYAVKEGDTLYGIAWEHNLDYRELAALNDIDPPYNIFPGQEIRLRKGGQADGARQVAQADSGADKGQSGAGGAVATGLGQANAGSGGVETDGQQGDDQQVDWLLPDEPADASSASPSDSDTSDKDKDADDSAEKTVVAQPEKSGSDASQSDKKAANKSDADKTQVAKAKAPKASEEAAPKSAKKDQPGTAKEREKRAERSYSPTKDIAWQWPVEGKITGRFDEDGGITAGIDIAGKKGQSVKAAGPGIVVYAGSGVRGYGNLVLLKHNDQFLSAYAHNDSLNVSENDVIEAGEVIATMGDSDSENVKLHFEVRKDGESQDPLTYLPSR
ncbi:MAG: peptidoglycan DD-metalloendopeptidase family protein [Halomonas subglaciescola]|nr:peptidoglycan DD-metalloendopeptidase family protein [Halomonas subglaciescola]